MTIKLKGSTDGSVSLQAPADTVPTGTDKTLILPTGVGSAGQFLKNSATAGTLEFADTGIQWGNDVSIVGTFGATVTGIPSGVDKIYVAYVDVSTGSANNTTQAIRTRVGAGSILNSGNKYHTNCASPSATQFFTHASSGDNTILMSATCWTSNALQ